jgi:uncharacterized repeat protein (TIGR01451 family)
MIRALSRLPLRITALSAALAGAFLLAGGTWGASAQEADLAITKFGPATAPANSNVVYTLNIVNNGLDDAASVTLTDPIPAGMTFVSLSAPAGWSCATPAVGSGGTVTCTTPSFTAGNNVNFTLTVFIPPAAAPGTFFTNIASVTSATFDPNDENNSSTAVTQVAGGTSADLSVSKSGPATVFPGQNIVYLISVLNGGPDAADTVQLSDPLPAGTTFVSLSLPAGWTCTTPAVGAGGTVNCSIASLANGAGGSFTLTVNVPGGAVAGTTYDNFATISAATTDPLPDNNTSTVSTTVLASSPDLAITKTHAGNATQGQTGFTYTITVSNVGTVGATGTTTVQDTLPAGLTATAIAGGGWSCNLGTLTCDRSDGLGVGASYPTITLTVNVASNAPANVTNVATVSNAGDPNNANDTATDPTMVTPTAVAGIDLTIAKTHSGNARAGQTNFAYKITVSNVGTVASSGTVTVTDVLPAGLTAVAITGAGWSCAVGATPTCTRADELAPGAAYPPITLTVRVAADAPANIVNTATVSGGGDINPANNTATDATTVTPRPDPTRDPDVVGLVTAQLSTAQRFASTQISNFNDRLEGLHDDNTGDQVGIRFGSYDQDECIVPGTNILRNPFDPKCAQARQYAADVAATDPLAYARSDRRPMNGVAPAPRRTSEYAFWSTGYVAFGSADPNAQRSGFTFNTSGVSAGVDYRFNPNFIAGFGVGYGRDSTNIGVNGTRSNAEAYNVAAYASYRPFRHFFIDGLVGYGALRFDSQRFVVDDAAFVYGQRTGDQIFASLTAAFQYQSGGLMLSPYARINAAWVTLNAFTESGGLGGALNYSSQSAEFVTSVLGLRGKYTFLTSWGSIAPRFRVEYNHDLSSASTILLQYADLVGPVYSLTIASPARDRMTFGVGADVTIHDVNRLAFDYQYGSDFLGIAWHRLKLRWESRF